ncbi:MAG: glutathione S-transferase family protein [SAR324 cluster bacterium]|nr:glutathione S-transferase family protein [SAR324 cluster bacterium]
MLSEKKIPFQVTEIDLKNKPDWFLEVSPYGKVPVLDHDGELVYESAVINEYLDETFTDVPMMGATPAERANLRIWIDFCNTRIQPGLVSVLRAEPGEFEAKVQAFEESLAMLEDYLAQNGTPDPFFAGKRFTLVDATYAPAFERFATLRQLRGYEIPGRFARVRRWMDNLAAHPSVQAHAIPLEELVANYTGFLPESVRQHVA